MYGYGCRSGLSNKQFQNLFRGNKCYNAKAIMENTVLHYLFIYYEVMQTGIMNLFYEHVLVILDQYLIYIFLVLRFLIILTKQYLLNILLEKSFHLVYVFLKDLFYLLIFSTPYLYFSFFT